MSNRAIVALTIAVAVGAGISGGAFFAFSTFVMPALDRLPPAQSITAMQAINRLAPNPWFMTALFGSALGAIALIVIAIARWGQPATLYQVVGSALYLVSVMITVAYHVPRNDALELLGVSPNQAAQSWASFYGGWLVWNHLRSLTAVAGATILTVAVRHT